MIYATGDGVARDDAQAVQWFQKAATQGNATAQVNLGLMYAEGSGVPRNGSRPGIAARPVQDRAIAHNVVYKVCDPQASTPNPRATTTDVWHISCCVTLTP